MVKIYDKKSIFFLSYMMRIFLWHIDDEVESKDPEAVSKFDMVNDINEWTPLRSTDDDMNPKSQLEKMKSHWLFC